MKNLLKHSFLIVTILLLLGSLLPPKVTVQAADYSPSESEKIYQSVLTQTAKKPSEAGKLQIINHNGVMTLSDESENPIQLRGMSSHGLQWFPEIINENAFATLSNEWDSNVIRLAMYVGEEGYATNPEVIKERVINGIELAKQNDMYVIVDWHVHAPGDPNAEVYNASMDFFKEISELYPNDPNIIYELANEPSSNSNGGEGVTNDAAGWVKIKTYAEPIIKMLRDNGNDNLVIVGSPNWSQRPDLAADNPVIDSIENTIYTVHFYSGSHAPAADSSDRENVMGNARYALENGVAVFSSEWGTSEANGNNGPYLEETDQWINFLNENNISWVNWSLTNKNETSAAFTPFMLGKSQATDLNPGTDQQWATEELSLSGEYVRARIKGIPYEPIDRSKYTEVLWDFNDETTQGFAVNSDSPIKDIALTNTNNTLQIAGLNTSNGISEGDFWDNARLSADNWGESVDILGAEQLTMDVIVDEPTTVSIAAIPQGPSAGWANPTRAIQVTEEDFVVQNDGTYKAVLTISKEDSPSLETIATSPDDNSLENIILFVGTESADIISIDNISVTGKHVDIPVIHDEKGEPIFPSDFESSNRQGWDWAADSGVKTPLTIENANDSNMLSWEFAYPDVKPTDNWASAPRLDFWMADLARGDNDYLSFDLFLDPIRATEGTISINLITQPPTAGYWTQASDTFDIDLKSLDSATVTPDGLYHFEAKIDLNSLLNIEDDTLLRNMLLIFADVESNFAGRMFVDNIMFVKDDTPPVDTGDGGDTTPPVDTGDGGDTTPPVDTGDGGDKTPPVDVVDGGDETPPVVVVDGDETPLTGESGANLPDTATSAFNLMLIGFLLLAGGATFIFIRKRNIN